MEPTTPAADVRHASAQELADAIVARGTVFARQVLLRLVRASKPDGLPARSDEALADGILNALAAAGPDGLSRSELLRRFRRCSANRLDRALESLGSKAYIDNALAPQPKRGTAAMRFKVAWL